METFGNQNQQKSAIKFYCKICDYGSSRKCNYMDHLVSRKHIKNTKMETLGNKNQQNQQKSAIYKQEPVYTCDKCDKQFKNRSGLWKHRKKCNEPTNDTISIKNPESQQDLLQYLIKENSEFKQLMIEQNQHILEQNKQMIQLSKKVGNNTNNFNLNVYLNETCKNAMNIMDFVNQLQIENNDLEETARLGFANGISRIFINGLKQMNVTDRPIHCSDLKRETIYIKDKDEWNKDNDDKPMLTTAIKYIANKNMKQILEWTKENPEYNDPTTKINDKYLKIVSESMSGSSKEETIKNYSKIVKNIIKETVIHK